MFCHPPASRQDPGAAKKPVFLHTDECKDRKGCKGNSRTGGCLLGHWLSGNRNRECCHDRLLRYRSGCRGFCCCHHGNSRLQELRPGEPVHGRPVHRCNHGTVTADGNGTGSDRVFEGGGTQFRSCPVVNHHGPVHAAGNNGIAVIGHSNAGDPVGCGVREERVAEAVKHRYGIVVTANDNRGAVARIGDPERVPARKSAFPFQLPVTAVKPDAVVGHAHERTAVSVGFHKILGHVRIRPLGEERQIGSMDTVSRCDDNLAAIGKEPEMVHHRHRPVLADPAPVLADEPDNVRATGRDEGCIRYHGDIGHWHIQMIVPQHPATAGDHADILVPGCEQKIPVTADNEPGAGPAGPEPHPVTGERDQLVTTRNNGRAVLGDDDCRQFPAC